MTPDTSNDIPAKQSHPDFVALLRARYRNYRAAKRAQGSFVFLTIAIPMFSVLLAPTYPQLKPYLALAAVILLLLDVGFIDPLQKDWMKRGAKLQEEFDTKVLGIPWNRFVAGAMVDREDVHTDSAKPLPLKRESELVPWYEPCVGAVSLSFGRLICQRTNITYDARLRRRYSSAMLYGAVALFFVAFLFGLAFQLDVSGLLLTVVVPFTPLFSWALREYRKQIDTVAALTSLKSESEKLWERALSGASSAELEKVSRELQDAIYQHRVRSPLVFDWVYDRLRNKNEGEARHAAQHLVAQAKTFLNKESAA
ncbi:S-4TM family putative pore-forming effector [Noviherbaspirillum sp. UKPF54]|uniref:S-4TM family putative pore-forming effector n=1 Tax=Noviherbaspirillum sp. UKPF54 TaxID=2601898 RepID=UPI0011B16E40|nr:S-4TM family putative pore-forming effector [Noviherbaspirillum sp. UKPF54]QDZ28700.1 ABC transporter ATP-binding protein [Noviherbaspirillum sp. UKPF54]